MVDHTHDAIHVGASPAVCFAVATDFTAYPNWASDVRGADVLARDSDGRATRVAYELVALGSSLRYVLDYDFSDAPAGFSWALVRGDRLRTLDGRYRFDAHEDGTRVTYDLDLDLSAPLPGIVKRRVAGRIVTGALRQFRDAAERASLSTMNAPTDPPPSADRDPVMWVVPGEAGTSRAEDAPDEAPGPGAANASPGSVPFDEPGREHHDLPSPSVLDVVVGELLGAVPEVRDHLLAAAGELLEAARTVLEAADRMVRDQRDQS
jgi:ribosome-associated toxin RatA of RatAB toxin-antitoxin module